MIMFQNLRQGSQVYLLHKGMNPYIEVGTIEAMPTMQMMGYYQPMIPLDITVRVGEKVVPYKQLPPNAEVANTISQSGEEVCVACSKESVNTELDQMMQKSVDAINSVPMHEQRIKTLQQIHEQLNPEKVREAQQAQEINSLKTQLADMKAMMADLTSQLKERNNNHYNNQRKE